MTVLRSGSATDVGRVRQINQDLPLESTSLFAVADGMGGHVGGEVASRVAIDTLLSTFTREPTTAGLQVAFSEANRAVWQESQDQSELRGMGTTLTAVALVGGPAGRDMLALANVGDSRAYVFSEGLITQVTADHSLAEERMRQGEMTEEEAAVHPQRHILTRALGISPDVEADMWELQLRSGDRIVLCSDGLSNEVSLEEMGEILSTQPDPVAAARRMVEVANEHGGSDNITVVVVDVVVGEDGVGPASVVKPIGARAGAPLVVAPMVMALTDARVEGETPPEVADALPEVRAPSTAPTPPVPSRKDVLAPGVQLGFGGDSTRLSSDGPDSGENFLRDTQTVPIARSSVRAGLPRPVPPVPADESRRARRRRLGIQRRITVRVVLFTLLIAAVPVGAFYVIHWYAYENWYPTVHGGDIVIEQGRSGGVLWFEPKVVAQTGVTTSEILPTALTDIKAGVQEPSLKAAKQYVANLEQAYLYQHPGTSPTGGGTAGIGPSGAIPTVTVPSSTTTTTTTTSPPGAP
jgi:protein phosphatase